jgi:hypothetical protein
MKPMTMMVAVGLLIAACGGSKLDGTYTDEMGLTTYRFTSGGKVYMSVMGIETELNYKVDGDKVKIGAPQGGNLIFTLLADGALSGPMGIRFAKATARPQPGTRPRNAAARTSRDGDIVYWMKSDLRNLVTAEEAYFADHVKYTSNLGAGFAVTHGNSIPHITLVGDGWTATNTNPNTRQGCAIFVGSTPIPPATREGAPACG